jgi:ribonucleoside-diphosphate reductase alpha chain
MNDGVLETLRGKYFLKDEQGELVETTPDEMYLRVARAVASVEKPEEQNHWTTVFYGMMKDNVFLPNSPTLMNAGTGVKSLAACFLVDMEDSMDSILNALHDSAKIFASGGGVGVPLSKLRANGDFISTTKGTSSGPVSFAQMFDAMVNTVKQGGKRRGAMMMTMNIDHPDIIEFIKVKRDHNQLNNMNLSVLLTDEFMETWERNGCFLAKDPQDGSDRLFNWPGSDTPSSVQAHELMDMIVDGMWSDGEPGIYFIDNAQKAHPFNEKLEEFRLIGPNPCGEATLRGYESCVLGSINLTKFVVDGAFDSLAFQGTVHTAIRFLDNVVDLSEAPLPKINEETKKTRKLGLGVMGLHDALLMLGLPYSISKSQDTRDTVNEIFSDMETYAEEASASLAAERGMFPAWQYSKYSYEWDIEARNACVMSIAPTGTLARICDVSFGIEPVSFFQSQNNLVDVQYENIHPLARPYIAKGEALPEYFEEAQGISPEDHIEMQSIVQQYVDQAVSKTVLLPNDCTKDKFAGYIHLAWKKGLKGVTFYRDGSRSDQPISNADVDVEAKIIPGLEKLMEDGYKALTDTVGLYYLPTERIRTDIVHGPSFKIKTPEGNIYFDVHYNDKEEVVETMLQLGDGFTDTEKGLANWAARLMSKALQAGIEYTELVKQGASTEFEHKSRAYPGRVFWYGTNGKKKPYRSIPEVCSDLIIHTVNKLANDDEEDEEDVEAEEIIQLLPSSAFLCPECGLLAQRKEGCWACQCGWSKC